MKLHNEKSTIYKAPSDVSFTRFAGGKPRAKSIRLDMAHCGLHWKLQTFVVFLAKTRNSSRNTTIVLLPLSLVAILPGLLSLAQ